MKKRVSVILALLLTGSMMAGCGGSAASSEATAVESTASVESEAAESSMAAEEEMVGILINTEGCGQIRAADEGEEISFDDGQVIQSIMKNGLPGDMFMLKAQADEGWKFLEWTMDDQSYSTDEEISVVFEEDAVFKAVFVEKVEFDPESAAIMADCYEYGSAAEFAFNSENFVYVFDVEGVYYRAIANMPEGLADEVYEIEDSDAQLERLGTLEIEKVENLTEAMPTQEELDALVGKTGADLLADGWEFSGFASLEDMEAYMYHGLFSYSVIFEGELTEEPDPFGDLEEIKPLVVKSAEVVGLGASTDLKNTVD